MEFMKRNRVLYPFVSVFQAGNNRAMRLLWCGRYFSTCTFFTHHIGITKVLTLVHAFLRVGIAFKVHYMILCLLSIPRMFKYYILTEDNSANRIAKWYVAKLLFGSKCWFCDRVFCKKISRWIVNPQGHTLWHVIIGFNSYLANTFLMFCRAHQRDWDPKVNFFLGVLPYVKIEKLKTQ